MKKEGQLKMVTFNLRMKNLIYLGFFTTSSLMVVKAKSSCSFYLYYLRIKFSLLKGVHVSPRFILSQF